MLVLATILLLLADADGLAALPGDFALRGPQARQALLLERVERGEFVGEAVPEHWVSDNPAVVRVAAGVAFPVADGEATLTALLGGRKASLRATVAGFATAPAPSFRNDVQPILARHGCSSGACHGAAAGQGGFKLSLRGYDELGDHLALTKHALGRRVDLDEPLQSLLFRKPTGGVPHKGGVRFPADSPDAATLAEWVAHGAPPPRPEDPRVVGIEILPGRLALKPGAVQRLLVVARFSDGTTRDATPWAKFAPADSTVADVDAQGVVRVAGYGQAAVTAWYLSKIAAATVSAPYPNRLDDAVFAAAPRHNLIDERNLAKLRELNLAPSPPCTDAEYLRRASLDAIGRLPAPSETKAFVADARPDKRERLADALLARPEFVDYWTHKWGDLLLATSKRLPRETLLAYHRWIRDQVAANAPWDGMARDLVTARGSVLENGAGALHLLQDDPAEKAETVSQIFLGMSIQCAKCHNHPLEKWTNNQYFAFANLFARAKAKAGTRPGDTLLFDAPDGELLQPLTGKPQPPAPLDGAALAADDPRDRRTVAAEWLTRPDNPYFARAIVNRVWANYFGAGLVEPVDDLRLTNPASNEPLLAALAERLAADGFDLKKLMRLVLASATYQRSSQPMPGNAADRRHFARAYPRRLPAEVALDALADVLEAPTEFHQAAERGKGDFKYPAGVRAMQLPDANIDSLFLATFGRPERVIACECERTNKPALAQALHLANGATLNAKLKAPGNRIDRMLRAHAADAAILDEAFLAALSRPPTDAERRALGAVLAGAEGTARHEAVEDLFWGLLTSREFLFNR